MSGNGLVVFQDYYNLDALLTDINFTSNNMSTAGSAVTFTFAMLDATTSQPTATHKLIMQSVQVVRQISSGNGVGVYISYLLCDMCTLDGPYTIKHCKFADISNINSVMYCSDSNHLRYSNALL